MLEIPVSALLICYGPLLVTVVGFVVFAGLTDVDSRRTYLRRLDPRPEAEQPSELPMLIKNRVTAETPSGSVVTIVPPGLEAGAAVAQLPSAPAPDAALPEPEAEPAEAEVVDDDEPDELTRLEGIGPKISDALITAGIDTFAKVAAASEDDFRAALEAAEVNFAPSMESWAEQASYAAKGDWDGLQKLQDTLVSGRYPTDDDAS